MKKIEFDFSNKMVFCYKNDIKMSFDKYYYEGNDIINNFSEENFNIFVNQINSYLSNLENAVVEYYSTDNERYGYIIILLFNRISLGSIKIEYFFDQTKSSFYFNAKHFSEERFDELSKVLLELNNNFKNKNSKNITIKPYPFKHDIKIESNKILDDFKNLSTCVYIDQLKIIITNIILYLNNETIKFIFENQIFVEKCINLIMHELRIDDDEISLRLFGFILYLIDYNNTFFETFQKTNLKNIISNILDNQKDKTKNRYFILRNVTLQQIFDKI